MEYIVILITLIVVKEEKLQRDNWGFKKSREAAINVIPILGFNVKEMGDHIPILKLIPITLSCFFYFFPQKEASHRYTLLRLTTQPYSEHVGACNKSLADDSHQYAAVNEQKNTCTLIYPGQTLKHLNNP